MSSNKFMLIFCKKRGACEQLRNIFLDFWWLLLLFSHLKKLIVILSVDTQNFFERYNEAQEAQAAYGEVVATTNKELKEMHEEIEKLGEKVNAIREKSENATFTEAAREKCREEGKKKRSCYISRQMNFIIVAKATGTNLQ
jgi:Skp family chaperone for outer membrane proteins